MDEVQTSPLVSVDIVVPAETPTSDKRVSPNITYVIDQQKQSSFVVNPLGGKWKGNYF